MIWNDSVFCAVSYFEVEDQYMQSLKTSLSYLFRWPVANFDLAASHHFSDFKPETFFHFLH